MDFLWALIDSLSGGRAVAADAPLFFTGGCQVPGCPVAIIAPDKWALTKEWRVVNLLLIWRGNLIETINQSRRPLSLLFCIIHFSHSQLQEFISPLSVLLPLMLTCTRILRAMYVRKINTKTIASLLPLHPHHPPYGTQTHYVFITSWQS